MANRKRIDSHWVGNILEFGLAKIADREIEPRLHLAIGVFRETNASGRCDTLQSRSDIDSIAHQVAVALFDHVAEMNADPKLDAAFRRQAGIALDHAVLHFNGTANGVDNAAKLDECAVACALDHSPLVYGDSGIDQVTAQRTQPRQYSILVGPRESTVSDDIRSKDCRKLSGLGHPASPLLRSSLTTKGWSAAGIFPLPGADLTLFWFLFGAVLLQSIRRSWPSATRPAFQ